MQRGIEALYRIDTELDVLDFVISETRRDALFGHGPVREQLLVREQDGELELGLYVDDKALENLKRNDPRRGLNRGNLNDFCLTFEGVSHFVYLAWRAKQGQPVTGLELELQAEVDKYVACLLINWSEQPPVTDLRMSLFQRVSFVADNDNERERYVVANRLANRYCRELEARYLSSRRLDGALAEVRRFYRLDQGAKLDRIAAAGC